jgi:hypothetical protein
MSNTPLHDHENKKQPTYCTLMKEICYSGWTKSMGEIPTPDGATVRPRCHKWVGIFVKKGIEGPTQEVFDCNEQWSTDLQQQIAQEIYQGAAATEQVRNGVYEQAGASRVALAFFQGIAKRMKAPIVIPDLPKANQLENGKEIK